MIFAFCGICFVGMSLTGAILWYRYDQAVVEPTQAAVAVVAEATSQTPPSETETAVPAANSTLPSTNPPALAPTKPPPTLVPLSATLLPPDAIDQQPVPSRAYTDLELLLATDYPINDYFLTAERLSASKFGDRTITSPQYKLGDTQTFITDSGNIEATLLGITEHAYFWVEDGLDYNLGDVQSIANRLEADYYPRLVNLFGQEWQPGVDNDPHFSILHLAGESNASELGYFSSIDEYPQTLYSDSNQQEIVYLVMGNLELGEDLYFGTLVHELQHLIQWYVDPNESTWLNEGLSQLAELYVGLDTATAIDYTHRPETRLNSWDYESDAVDAHYSGAYLYSVYVWEQLGETAVQELSRHPANGLAAVQAILQGYAPERTLSDFSADWVAANFLDNPNAGSQFFYEHLDLGRPSFEWRIKELPQEKTFTLEQYGTHYIDLDVRGPLTITFAGNTTAPLINSDPRSGEQIWYAPGQDETNAQLTAAFDLTELNSATLTFAAWYDLEEEYDYAYISISTDEGASWDLLVPDHTSAGEFGPSYNGRSEFENDHVDGWVKETISLNSYVGQPVLVRFDVLTDSAISGQGFALDDLTIPELGFQDNAEEQATEWEAKGFVQIGKQLPQQWAVQFIEPLGPDPQVTRLMLNELNQGQWQLNVGKKGGVLAITPLTPYVDSPADYWLTIE
ncbi:MAG: immune inhibitor A [Anaerolineae bacterium]|nr:immune inhibitor A [Anaerolineae bacterium]